MAYLLPANGRKTTPRDSLSPRWQASDHLRSVRPLAPDADNRVVRPDPDKVFATREEAESVRDRLNESPPEWGYSPWYLGGPVDGQWWVIRARGVIADDLGMSARKYEEAFRAAVQESARNRDFWRDAEGIVIKEVSLDGTYPDTRLIVVFCAVPSQKVRFGQPSANCRFGIRWRIWPAEYTDPATEASFHDIYFAEFLGTNRAGYGPVRGVSPCDPNRINWLE
jgi:hypothetical protein